MEGGEGGRESESSWVVVELWIGGRQRRRQKRGRDGTWRGNDSAMSQQQVFAADTSECFVVFLESRDPPSPCHPSESISVTSLAFTLYGSRRTAPVATLRHASRGSVSTTDPPVDRQEPPVATADTVRRSRAPSRPPVCHKARRPPLRADGGWPRPASRHPRRASSLWAGPAVPLGGACSVETSLAAGP